MPRSIFVVLAISLLASSTAWSRLSDSTDSSWSIFSMNRSQVRRAVEIESLFPMFFFGGYHVGVGYRLDAFRVRASVINGGDYDAEPAGIPNARDRFKRMYSRPGYGLFFGYNVWRNWDVYTHIERHTFGIEQKATSEMKTIYSTDLGVGTSYQLFVGRRLYVQPGVHLYLRGSHSVTFSNGSVYSIPRTDLSPVIRIGMRLWQED